MSDPRADFKNLMRFFEEQKADPYRPRFEGLYFYRQWKAKPMSDKVTIIKVRVAEASKRLWRDLLWLGLIVLGIMFALGACGALEFFTCYYTDDTWVRPSECSPLNRARR